METVMAREAGFSNGSGLGSHGSSVPPPAATSFHTTPQFAAPEESAQELMGLGLNEQLPPFELMEEL